MSFTIDDVQNNPDCRNLPVDRVGIRRLKFPITFEDISGSQTINRQSVVAYFDMLVDLPKTVKGTHMSRFIEILNEDDIVLSVEKLPALMAKMVSRLDAEYGYFQAQFPYFIQKTAPVSKVKGLMDYEVTFNAIFENKKAHVFVTLVVPVTSLCPCSKKIADYGAHNQRSHVTVTVEAKTHLSLIEIIQMVESKASCELYSILKRSDEKAVTERAYNNPKFVEDMVRDVASALAQQPGVLSYKVASENFESIHNHSAYAEIDRLSKPTVASAKAAIKPSKIVECPEEV